MHSMRICDVQGIVTVVNGMGSRLNAKFGSISVSLR